MRIFSAAFELVGDVGFGVIKNSARIIYGSGKAILGVVTEDEKLISEGTENAGKGAVGLGFAMFGKTQGEDSVENEAINSLDE